MMRDANSVKGKAKILIYELSVFLIPILIFILIFYYFELRRKSELLTKGVISKAVIVDYETNVRSSTSYIYIFCIEEVLFYGKLANKNEIHDWFIYGDIITVIYNPKNPRNNKPIIQAYAKDSSVIKQYINEIPKFFKYNPGIYKERRKGFDYYNWVTVKEKYPINKEAFPCLPPQYYGEF